MLNVFRFLVFRGAVVLLWGTLVSCSNSSHYFNGIYDLEYAQNQVVAVGYHSQGGNLQGLIYSSSDGQAWKRFLWPKTTELTNLCFAQNTFIATGSKGMVLTSSDGLNWIEQKMETEGILMGAAYGNGIFVLVGAEANPSKALVFTGNHPNKCKEVKTDIPSSIERVVFGKGVFVAATKNSFYLSTDGLIWQEQKPGVRKWQGQDLLFAQDKFFAIDRERTILSSSDGKTWEKTKVSRGISLSMLDYQRGNLIAYGTSSGIKSEPVAFLSSDGKEWQKTDPLLYPPRAVFNGEKYLTLINKIVWSSSDGENWVTNSIE